ncbi:MAG: NADPH:quinone oxidoreductase family protein [Cyclobacteriaceae bacterium]
MKALFTEAFGSIGNLKFGEVKLPEVSPDSVLIDVAFAGVNYPDTLIVKGLYQFKPSIPFSPGCEVSGIVKEVGEDVAHVAVGDRVIGITGWGGYAEHVVVKEEYVYKIPDNVELKEASVLLETYATAYHGLKDRGALMHEETLVVLGASGGTGSAAVEIGKTMGAKVIAVASTDEKRSFCEALGADVVLGYEHIKEKLKKFGGVDVVFDPVGGEVSEQVFRTLKPNGRHLVVGFAGGNIPALPWNLPLLKSASIVGVFWGSFWRNNPGQNKENNEYLIRLLSGGFVKPRIKHEFELKDGVEALRMLEDREMIGKGVLSIKASIST